MKNYLLKKSVREELERRGISYGEYMAERNALRTEARQEKAAERTPKPPAVAATRPEESTQLQREVRTEQGRIRKPTPTPPAHREPAESGPATWLQLPAINIGPQVDVVGEQHYQEAIEAVAAGRNAFGTRTRVLTVALVREPDNPYDTNAVRVEAAEAIVGHLGRDDAPRFHAIINRLASAGSPATCRAMLTGGWERGGDRGYIGLKVFTGRRPARWNGRVAFLPTIPWYEDHIVTLNPGGSDLSGLSRQPVATLAALRADGTEVSVDGVVLGHIRNRPDIAAYVTRVHAAGLPTTAKAQVADGQLIVSVVDGLAVIAALDRLGSGDLAAIRRQLHPTGRWICQRCNRIWTDPRRPPQRWYEIEDENCGSPHICPGCWSYKFTHPL
ncbi:MAG: HIRAN domain-containing protein [Streptosporangiaceae bacterium]